MTSNNNYVITHLHTAAGSLRDSIIQNDVLVKRVKELGMTSVCITDHGSLSNMYAFYYECKKEGIKPIIGCEVYYCQDRFDYAKDDYKESSYHMILIAKNNNGVKNLLKITAEAEMTGFYYKPRIDMDLLREYGQDLICATACIGGYAPFMILQNEYERAEKHILQLKEIFGDDLFLEIQPGNFEQQHIVNEAMIKYHKRYNIKLIATNDVHYVYKDEWKLHDFHVRIGQGKKAPDDPEETLYPDKCYYIMEYNELLNSFDSQFYDKEIIKEAIDNTNIIGESCNVEFHEEQLNLPEFINKKYTSPREHLEDLAFKRLHEIQYDIYDPSIYVSRIYEELDTIDKLGFSSYFLIIRDIIRHAEEIGIMTGPGRGSVSGLSQWSTINSINCGNTPITLICYNGTGNGKRECGVCYKHVGES